MTPKKLKKGDIFYESFGDDLKAYKHHVVTNLPEEKIIVTKHWSKYKQRWKYQVIFYLAFDKPSLYLEC